MKNIKPVKWEYKCLHCGYLGTTKFNPDEKYLHCNNCNRAITNTIVIEKRYVEYFYKFTHNWDTGETYFNCEWNSPILGGYGYGETTFEPNHTIYYVIGDMALNKHRCFETALKFASEVIVKLEFIQ